MSYVLHLSLVYSKQFLNIAITLCMRSGPYHPNVVTGAQGRSWNYVLIDSICRFVTFYNYEICTHQPKPAGP